MPRENRVEKSRVHFSWQAQYLVKLECDFSWQAQHLVTFWEIAGARNVVFFNTKSCSRSDEYGLRSGGCEMRFSDRIVVGLSSDYPRIVFILAEAIQRVSAAILNSKISWQAQYLLRLEVDIACSAHCKWRFMCDADQSWDSFCVAGAVFAEVGGWLCLLCAMEMTFHMRRGSIMRFILRGRRSICWGSRLTLLAPRILNDVSYVTRINHEMHFAWQAQYLVKLDCHFSAGAAFGDILGDSRSAKCCIFQYKIVSKIGRVRSPKRRVRDDDFMVGSWSGYPRIVFILAEAIQRVPAAILNLKISWQAQYLLRLEVDIACSAHWKCRFIWDAHQSWDSFCVAGAVFGEVGLSLFVAGAAFGDILGDSRSAKCCIFQCKIVSKIGRVRSPKRRVRDDDFMVGSWSDYPRIVFILAEAIQRVSAAILNLKISWQAQYLLRLEVDIACSAHWKWSFIWDADQPWDSFCVAGAVFAEVGGWHCLLRPF